ncbi:MAG TPA: acireductone synthase [Pyrinomonadaceae bacterium]|nr:acireductone synthase [Pyrinomonadaceae bacterium]
MKAILLDIEGTTTPIDFVHQTLFPFAKAKIGDYLDLNLPNLKREISEIKLEYKKDFTNQIYGRKFDENSAESIAEYLRFLIEVDRKSTPLKSLQGKIWQAGYEAGELKSEMFEDVPRAFERWYSQGKTIAIYSSGSVLAQKLIFKYSNFGDLTHYISAYFDTNIGHKREKQSYENIAEKLQNRKREILFISDVLEELNAAHEAGLDAILSDREGNALITKKHSFQVVQSFDTVNLI